MWGHPQAVHGSKHGSRLPSRTVLEPESWISPCSVPLPQTALSLIPQPLLLVDASKSLKFILATTSGSPLLVDRLPREYFRPKKSSGLIVSKLRSALTRFTPASHSVAPKWLFSKSWIVPVNASFLLEGQGYKFGAIGCNFEKLKHSHLHPYFILTHSMVRVTRNSKTSVRVAGCAQSHHTLPPHSSSTVPRVTSVADRDKARADAMQSKKCAEVKAKLRPSRYGTMAIPAADLLVCHSASLDFSVFLTAYPQNELPAKVREEVEAIRNCCLACVPSSLPDGDATPRVVTVNIHKHQLFSKEHADNLNPEIRQWLPRLVCPAFPLSAKCHGQCVVV
jgi:hypothetical protein